MWRRARRRKGRRGLLQLFLIAAAVLVSAQAKATSVGLSATAIGSVVDDAGGIADGTFDRVDTLDVEVDATNNFTYRAVMEYGLAPVPAGSIVESARLQWSLGSATNPPVTVQLYGYVGD